MAAAKAMAQICDSTMLPELRRWLDQPTHRREALAVLSECHNPQVAAYFVQLCGSTSLKVNAQVLATALAVYVTDKQLAGTVATGYGFSVTDAGTATSTYNVGSYGTALGLTNNTSMDTAKWTITPL